MKSAPYDLALAQVQTILRSAEEKNASIAATELFNETWLLRLVLSAAERGIACLPFTFASGARWFSEARLYSRFQSTHRGQGKNESPTRVDGVVGHFSFRLGSKTGLRLKDTGSQFIVIEAKVSSGLRRNTKNAENYDQAARIVACMANVLERSGRDLADWQSLGFYVLAPAKQIEKGLFTSALTRESILRTTRERITGYGFEREGDEEWEDRWLKPLVARMQIEPFAWEKALDCIELMEKEFGEHLRRFYELTLSFSGLKSVAESPPGYPVSVVDFRA